MTPHEKAMAFISEFADDYVVVLRVGNETAVGVSDSDWAREILASGQVETAIKQHDEYLKNIEAQNREDAARRHHGQGLNGPGWPKRADSGTGNTDGL